MRPIIKSDKSCDGCANYLGGGRDGCKMDIWAECAEGGGYEGWREEAPER